MGAGVGAGVGIGRLEGEEVYEASVCYALGEGGEERNARAVGIERGGREGGGVGFRQREGGTEEGRGGGGGD